MEEETGLKNLIFAFLNLRTLLKKGLVPQVARTSRSSYCKGAVFFVMYEKTHNCVVYAHAALQI